MTSPSFRENLEGLSPARRLLLACALALTAALCVVLILFCALAASLMQVVWPWFIAAGALAVAVIASLLLRPAASALLAPMRRLAEQESRREQELARLRRELAEQQSRERAASAELMAARQEAAEHVRLRRELYMGALACLLRMTPQGRIESVNRAMARLLGFDSPEAALEALPGPEALLMNPDEARELIRAIKQGRALNREEVEMARADGSNLAILLSSRVVRDEQNHPLFIELAAEDVSEFHRRLEEVVEERTNEMQRYVEDLNQAKEAQEDNAARLADAIYELEKARADAEDARAEAEEANRTKTQFLANMSHEIRTPMNAIIGMADMVATTSLDAKQREYVHIIRSSAQSLLGLINDILDVSKIEAGKLELEAIPFELRDILEEVSDMFLEKVAESEIELIMNVGPHAPARVVSDPLRLRQVLVNLTSNAFKFTEAGEIEIKVEQLSRQDDLAWLRFTVRDTGIGIPEHVRERLFEAFTQADGSTTRKYGGTGLGLTICRNIVELMGGDIWVEGEEGVGSSFIFTAPLQLAEDQKPHPVVQEPEHLAGLRVLAVDDNQASLLVLERILTMYEVEPVLADSAEQALQALGRARDEGRPFDLVLMDWRLPAMDGIEAAGVVRREFSDDAPPVIIMTAYGREAEMRRSAEAGVQGFLIKPVKPSVLVDSMLEVLGHETSGAADTGPLEVDENALVGRRVLVVEDNPVNQRVAVEILRSLGVESETAVDGREGVRKVLERTYDAVLMDVQMPELDGYAATRAIRQEPRLAELPIIAMTANAMRGDRELCLEAGMNDYVAKPVERRDLFAALIRRLPPDQPGAAPGPAKPTPAAGEAEPPPETPGLDLQNGLERIGGSLALYTDIAVDFLDNQQGFFEAFPRLVEQGEHEQAVRIAHSLKGAAANLSARRLQEEAKAVEAACRENDWERAMVMLPGLEAAFREAEASIRDLQDRQNAEAQPPDQPQEQAPPPEAPEDDLAPLFEELAGHLDNFDPLETTLTLQNLKKRLDKLPEARDNLDQLEAAVAAYDFDQAVQALQALREAALPSSC